MLLIELTSLIYNLSIRVYQGIISVASFFNYRAKEWKDGRKDNLHSLKGFRSQNTAPLIWFHCASLGEFEQALPIIEKIRSEGKHLITCTFFSPSGYKYQKNNKLLDWVGYLPLDLKDPMQVFIEVMNPTKVIIVKNEWWWNMLSILDYKNIPTFFISSKITKDHYFIKYNRPFFSNILKSIQHFFVINDSSKKILSKFIDSDITTAGDTKIDRVIQNALHHFQDDIIELYVDPIIYGSLWRSDLDQIGSIILKQKDRNHIIFPHNVDKETISGLQKVLGQVDLYSNHPHKNSNILIVDQVGFLKYALRYASHIYIGGGFGEGIHNVLEAIVYKVPVSCGPRIIKVPEAVELSNKNLLSIIEKKEDFVKFLDYSVNSQGIEDYFLSNKGAVKKIYSIIKDNDS